MTATTSERHRAAPPAGRPDEPSDEAFQERILQGVSRTFALTIPELPPGLASVVGNGYLLCRIADTIEDVPGLPLAEKRRLHQLLVEAVEAEAPEVRRRTSAALVEAFAPLCALEILPAERELLQGADRVLRLTHGYGERQRAALARCVRIMSQGMDRFQEGPGRRGLESIGAMHAYCYYVAGVVGEMLTELFCAHAPDIEANRAGLERLTVSFGQGLQMTNILKDVRDDHARGFCWLPRDVFEELGFDLAELRPDASPPAFRRGMRRLVAIAHGHLADALDYTLLVPARHVGIRRFCLRALGMAVLSLRKIHRRPGFTAARQVKIKRRTVHATVAVSNLAARSDATLRLLFRLASAGLPHTSPRPVWTTARLNGIRG